MNICVFRKLYNFLNNKQKILNLSTKSNKILMKIGIGVQF